VDGLPSPIDVADSLDDHHAWALLRVDCSQAPAGWFCETHVYVNRSSARQLVASIDSTNPAGAHGSEIIALNAGDAPQL
jgi:hypothetical protein